MARKSDAAPPAPAPAEALDAVVAGIGAMTAELLRARWRQTFASDPPAAFPKDLLTRAICYRLQEDALGGLRPATNRLLRSLGRPGAEPQRPVKIGSVIVREHRGVMHEVLVVPGGFCWQGKTYDSLSSIAKKITGTSWNGPRFFGLRSQHAAEPENDRHPSEPKAGAGQGGRRSSFRSSR